MGLTLNLTLNPQPSHRTPHPHPHLHPRPTPTPTLGDDALMTMELYKHWVGLGQPDRIELTGLQFYVVNAHR